MNVQISIQILIKSRFYPWPDATARRVRANVWEVSVPRTAEAERRFGKDLRGLDEAVLLIGDEETQPALISAEGPEGVRLTAIVL